MPTNNSESQPLPSPAQNPLPEIQWEGHMSDDVAATFGPEPTAFLRATRDEVVLSGSRGTFVMPRSTVTRVGRGKMYPWFFAGIRIHHNIERYPRELQFKPLGKSWRIVVQELADLGFPVK